MNYELHRDKSLVVSLNVIFVATSTEFGLLYSMLYGRTKIDLKQSLNRKSIH